MGDGDEWRMMWGAKVKVPLDMPDDVLKDAITTTRDVLQTCQDFEKEGACIFTNSSKP